MAVIPNTPSALKVFRSAWIPAPPPESEPAIESARGRGGRTSSSTETRLPVGEVIPARGFERRRPAVGVHGHDAGTRDDLADLGQIDAEPRPQLLPRALDGV